MMDEQMSPGITSKTESACANQEELANVTARIYTLTKLQWPRIGESAWSWAYIDSHANYPLPSWAMPIVPPY